MNEGIVQIPLISSRQFIRQQTPTLKKFKHASLPLRLNQAGVMPLVFTSYAMSIFRVVFSFLKTRFQTLSLFQSLSFFVFDETILYWGGKLIFWALYCGLIFFFTDFYSTLVLDPKDVAEQLQKNSAVILGIRPGNPTKAYLKKTLSRIARINALFLITNIIGLQIIEASFHLNLLSLRGLGFTSQLILVNVLIDTFRKVRSYINEDTDIVDNEIVEGK